MRRLLLALLFLVFPVALASSGPPGCMSPTVVDGYVYFANGSVAQNANISVYTSASDCNFWTAQTDSFGYYAIPGLNIQSQTVTSSASVFVPGKGTFDGVNSSYSSGSTIRINIIIRPSAPILTAIADRHNGTNIQFAWVSGIEPSTDTTYDQFALLPNSFENKVSPQTANLSFGSYTWKVRTCNSKVCSTSSSDSFQVYNTRPSAPALKEINYTSESEEQLSWNSGTDTDTLPTDSLTDELQVASDESFSNILFSQSYNTTSNKTHSVTVSGLEPAFNTFYWRVRTCDDTGASNNCSSYSTDSFFRYFCEAAEVCPAVGGEGRRIVPVAKPSFAVTLVGPSQVEQGKNLSLLVNFKSNRDYKEVLFDVAAPTGFAIAPLTLKDYKAESQRNVVLTGGVAKDVPPKQYGLTLKVSGPKYGFVQKDFDIAVLKGVLCGNGVCEEGESAETCIQDCHCGNNICEADFGESPESCVIDCPPPSRALFVTGFWFWLLVLIIVATILCYKLLKRPKRKKS